MNIDIRRLRGEFFVAAMPPPHIAAALYAAFSAHRKKYGTSDEWDWKAAGHFHVTLGIAGEVSIADVGILEKILTESGIKPFTANTTRTGHFLKNINNRSNRHVLWAGFDAAGTKGFENAHAAVHAGFKAHHLKQYQHEFQPHITTARPHNPVREALKNLVADNPALPDIPTWDVGHISIFQRLPRRIQTAIDLPHRFHEVARFDLKARTSVRVGKIIVPHGALSFQFV
jgi:2'-5' RNA ligase